MLTKIRIQNFKQFDDVEIELGPVTVLIGPNNSGKTTILQALMLWYAAVEEIYRASSQSYSGYTKILDRLLTTIDIPGPYVTALWRDFKYQNVGGDHIRIDVSGLYSYASDNIEYWQQQYIFHLIEVDRIGITTKKHNDFRDKEYLQEKLQLFLVQPVDVSNSYENNNVNRNHIINVIRNLCFSIHRTKSTWKKFAEQIQTLFGVALLAPQYMVTTNKINLSYSNQKSSVALDIASAGRGMLQIILVLAYMYDTPGATLLLDEPDNHLEILLHKRVYNLIKQVAQETKSQIIIATHSADIMDEAFEREDKLIVFFGSARQPIQIDYKNRQEMGKHKQQLPKLLKSISFADYYKAIQTGFALYLEDFTDYDILLAFAERLAPDKVSILARAFVSYLHSNNYGIAASHLDGIRHVFPHVRGIVILDQTGKQYQSSKAMRVEKWRRREIENYLCQPQTLLAFAKEGDASGEREKIMQDILRDEIPPCAYDDMNDMFWNQKETKVSDVFLARVFKRYAQQLGKSYFLPKNRFYELVRYIPSDLIDPEVIEKLDAIWDIAKDAPNT